jgi:hypothetical protein
MTKLRRALGYSSFVCGGLATVIGLLPIFPVFGEALLVGGGFFALGIWALLGPELRMYFRHLAGSQTRKNPVRIDPLLPVQILSLAKKKAGLLTVSDVAIALSIPLEQAEEGLRACVRGGNAHADFDIARGFSLYRFPEFLPSEDRGLLS